MTVTVHPVCRIRKPMLAALLVAGIFLCRTLTSCTKTHPQDTEAIPAHGSRTAPDAAGGTGNIQSPRSKQGAVSMPAAARAEIFNSVPTITDDYIPLFNTVSSIQTDGTPESREMVIAMEEELIHYHKLFDEHHFYYQGSPLDTNTAQGIVQNARSLNEHLAQGIPFQAESPLYELVEESLALMKLTRGYFNPFVEPVLALYDGKFSPFPLENTDPDRDAVAAALAQVPDIEEARSRFVCAANAGSSPLGGTISLAGTTAGTTPSPSSLEAAGSSIALAAAGTAPRPASDTTTTGTAPSPPTLGAADTAQAPNKNYCFNFGAISKGFAAQKIHEHFADGTYLLNLGSSTQLAVGKGYRVGIVSPYYKTLSLAQIELPPGISISTSGTTNNYYILADDHETIRCHIINPYTGYPEHNWWSVTVVSDNAMVADAVSTALFSVGDPREVLEIVAAVKAHYESGNGNRHGGGGSSGEGGGTDGRAKDLVLEVCFVEEVSRGEKLARLRITHGFEQYLNTSYNGLYTEIVYVE